MKLYLRVLSYIKPYRMMVLLSLVSSILYVIMNTFSIWMISSLISNIMNSSINKNVDFSNDFSIHSKLEKLANQMIGNGSQLEQLGQLCIILIITFIFKNLFFYINNVSISFVQNKMIMDIRNQLFNHLQQLPLSFFNKSKSGELSSIIMNDVSNMRIAFTQSIQSLINEPLHIIVLIGMLFIISSKLTLFVLLTFPLSAFIISNLGKSIRRKATRSSLSIAGIMNIIQETLGGIRIIKAFVMEKKEIKKFKIENNNFFKLTFKQENMRNLMTPINDLIGVSVGVLLLWFGGKEVLIHGTLSSDGFIRFIIFLFAMLQPARKLGNVNAQIQAGLASSERVFSLLDVKSNIVQILNPIEIKKFKTNIIFDNVSFKYENSKEYCLKNISFKINKGMITALVGSSGSGKTTIADLLPRFFDVNKGKIIVDGYDIRDISTSNLRSLMGIVSQDIILFNDTIANNISYGLENINLNNIKNAAQIANAFDFINNLPDGFNTIIGERGVSLSGGQRQRISIARAILKNPEILIFDEATSALDSDSETKVQNAIDNLVKNRTVIIIAHRLSTITNANQIIVLDDGQVKEIGSHDKLINNNSYYKKLYDMQFGSSIL